MMEAEIAVLAATAGATVAQLLATDGWAAAKAAVGALWRRAHPDDASIVAAELESDHDRAVAARDGGDDVTAQALVAAWQLRFRELLAGDPEIASLLRRMLDEELTPQLIAVESAPVVTVHMQATSHGSGRVYQAARDQHITER
jgi:hypothetical protein